MTADIIQIPSTAERAKLGLGKKKPRKHLEPGTWGAVTRHCQNDSRLTAGELRVLICISGHADAEGYAWPAQTLIAEETNLYRSTVNRAIQRLRELGYLDILPRPRRHGHWGSNGYLVLRKKPAPEPPSPCSPR